MPSVVRYALNQTCNVIFLGLAVNKIGIASLGFLIGNYIRIFKDSHFGFSKIFKFLYEQLVCLL